jgi:hypothetical protein
MIYRDDHPDDARCEIAKLREELTRAIRLRDELLERRGAVKPKGQRLAKPKRKPNLGTLIRRIEKLKSRLAKIFQYYNKRDRQAADRRRGLFLSGGAFEMNRRKH